MSGADALIVFAIIVGVLITIPFLAWIVGAVVVVAAVAVEVVVEQSRNVRDFVTHWWRVLT